MELAQARAQQFVFDPRQYRVADELVQRHAAAQRAGWRQHARAEDRRGLARAQGLEKFGQASGAYWPSPWISATKS